MIAGPCLRAADDTTDGRGAAVLMLASSEMNYDHAWSKKMSSRSGNGWSLQTLYGSHRVGSMKTSVAAYLPFPIGLAMGYALQRHLGAKRTAVAPVWRVLGTHKGKFPTWMLAATKCSGLDYRHATMSRLSEVELLDLY